MTSSERRPRASDEIVERRMRAQRRRDTKPELALRRVLHARGRRFFVDRAPLAGLRRRADLVFPRRKVAVFVDGCYWHGCPEHGTTPKRNREWWVEKIHRNKVRDRDTDAQLAAAGWVVVRLWEHVPAEEGADRVEAVLGA